MRLRLGTLFVVLIAVRIGADAEQPPSVSATDGNISLAGKQLTSSGRDSDPALSPDGKMVAFVRATPKRKVEAGSGDDTSELWLIASDATKPTRLVEPHGAPKMDNVVALVSNPHFSCDGKRLFFETTAWVTSGAVHVIDLATRREHFVCGGGALKIVRAGDYRDCLLVQQHRYFIGGGSFDWFWLVRPNGKEVGPVGEDTKMFEETYAAD
jgi:dipeptidyl aminopeptidase/acylaminoacyl peptidase